MNLIDIVDKIDNLLELIEVISVAHETISDKSKCNSVFMNILFPYLEQMKMEIKEISGLDD